MSKRLALPAILGTTLPQSAGYPTPVTYNTSASDAISPVNWSGQAGDSILSLVVAESFAGTFGVPYVTNPEEGVMLFERQATVGGGEMYFGAWLIPSYSGSSPVDLNLSNPGGAIAAVFHQITVWRTHDIQPENVGFKDIFIGAGGQASYVGSDNGVWTQAGGQLQGPVYPGLSDATDFYQVRAFATADDGAIADTDGYYTGIQQVSTTLLTDATIGHAYLNSSTPMSGSGSRLGQVDLDTASYAIAGANMIIGSA